MNLAHYSSLIDTQARMALKADAARYYLSYIWWLLEPLLYVAVFYLVFDVMFDSNRADFLAFLMCGKLPFMWISKSVTQASNSIVGNKGMIAKIDIPKAIFPLAAVQEGMYRQTASFALLLAFLISSGYEVSAYWLWLIPLIFINYLLIVLMSLIGAMLVSIIRDFSMVISLGMIFLLFTSGIFWDVREFNDPALTNLVLLVNPVCFILDAYRQVLMYQTVPDLVHLFSLGLVCAFSVLLMISLMVRVNNFLAYRVLST